MAFYIHTFFTTNIQQYRCPFKHVVSICCISNSIQWWKNHVNGYPAIISESCQSMKMMLH